MLKKSYVCAGLMMLFVAPSCTKNNKIETIKASISSIEQAIKDVITEQELMVSINKKAKAHLMNKNVEHMMDFYRHEELEKKIHSILSQITPSDLFITTINHVTDFQIACIIDKHTTYNNIEYSHNAYPLEQQKLIQVIDKAVADNSLRSYADGELLFNVYYLEATQNLGYKLLLEKLDAKKNALLTELATLETAE